MTSHQVGTSPECCFARRELRVPGVPMSVGGTLRRLVATVAVLVLASATACSTPPPKQETGSIPDVEQGSVAVDGGTIHYARTGSGPPPDPAARMAADLVVVAQDDARARADPHGDRVSRCRSAIRRSGRSCVARCGHDPALLAGSGEPGPVGERGALADDHVGYGPRGGHLARERWGLITSRRWPLAGI